MSLPLSHRSANMPASPIRKLAPFAVAAAARGIKIYHLNIGQPDIPTPDTFWDAVKNTDISVLEYSPSDGIMPLREGMAKYYQSIGIDVTAAQIMVTTAGSEALSIAMNVCCNEGDEIIVPEPMYANYLGFSRACNVNVVAIPTRIEDNFALPDAADIAKRITPKTKAILNCNPGNPTGTIYSRDQMIALGEIAREHGLFIISDEVYREFNYTDTPLTSALQLEGLDANTIMVDSVSKRFSLCGARVGFLVSRNPTFNAAALKYAQARLSPPMLEMIGTLGALDTPRSYFDDVRTEYMKRRDLLVSRLRSMPGVVCPDIEGAFYATVRLPIDNADTFCQWLLESFDHNGETVMFAPASGFYETDGAGVDEVRIAYVLDTDRLGKAMDCLEAALAAYPGRKVAANA